LKPTCVKGRTIAEPVHNAISAAMNKHYKKERLSILQLAEADSFIFEMQKQIYENSGYLIELTKFGSYVTGRQPKFVALQYYLQALEHDPVTTICAPPMNPARME
jgi:hypothetical protein